MVQVSAADKSKWREQLDAAANTIKEMQKEMKAKKETEDELRKLLKESQDDAKQAKADLAVKVKELEKSGETFVLETGKLNADIEGQKKQLEEMEGKVALADQRENEWQQKEAAWIKELLKINGVMAKTFLESEPHATQAVDRARAARHAIPDAWMVEDYLAAIVARLRSMQKVGVDFLDVAVRVFRILWPGVAPPSGVDKLVRVLATAEDRFAEWKLSSARAGADQALTYVCSWYSGIKLDKLDSIRGNSEWVSDPVKVAERQMAASCLAPWSSLSTFFPETSQWAEVEEDVEEEGAADDDDAEVELEEEVDIDEAQAHLVDFDPDVDVDASTTSGPKGSDPGQSSSAAP